MEGVLSGDSSVNQPQSERVPPLPLTKEAIMSLNNNSVTFEHARSLFYVDLLTFKAKLLEFNILVWKDANGLHQRYSWGNMIENALGLTRRCYRLTYEQPQTSAYELLETDLDWHYAVEYSNPSEWTLAKGKVSLLKEAEDRVIPPSDEIIAIIDHTIADELKDAPIGKGKKSVAFDGAQLPVKKAKTMAAYDEYPSDESDFHESDYDDSFS
nr:YTH domain-containing family protein [Tanacetum cinerariifolium]